MNILLAVTGSISAYKSYDIARGLIKDGHKVRVVLTKGAQEFVNIKVYQYLGVELSYSATSDFELSEGEKGVLHIDLVKWADRLVVAPTSANTIAKFANGICNDLLSSIFLALGNKTCILFPAMNTNMLSHPATQRNLQLLQTMPNLYIQPTEYGELACGDTGLGKLPSVELITTIIPLINLADNLVEKKRNILITTGATIAPLDPVRYLTNPSSGLTGLEMAKAFLAQGDNVTILYGPNSIKELEYLKAIPGATLIKVHTTQQMLDQATMYFSQSDIYISAAAICDIEFKESAHKIKKSQLESALAIQSAPDVLGTMIQNKKSNQLVISFAAETNTRNEIFLEKWKRKPVSLLIGNPVNSGHTSEQLGFGKNSNKYFFIQEGKVTLEQNISKKELAQRIVSFSNTGKLC